MAGRAGICANRAAEGVWRRPFLIGPGGRWGVFSTSLPSPGTSREPQISAILGVVSVTSRRREVVVDRGTPRAQHVQFACSSVLITLESCTFRARFETRSNAENSARFSHSIRLFSPRRRSCKSMFFRERLDFIQRVDFPPRRRTSGPTPETSQPLEGCFFLALPLPAFPDHVFLLYLLF